MAQMTPEEFARGTQQALGKAPTQPRPVKSDTPPPRDTFAEMVRQTDRAWPPRRTGRYPSSQNDLTVVRFITELFGPMISEAEATKQRPYLRGSFGSALPWVFWTNRGVPYGGDGLYGACWAAPDEAWRIVYEGGHLDYECYRRPDDDDLRKLCFLVGWFKVRTDCHFMQYDKAEVVWRRGHEMASEPKRGAA
jgi:hypothetical protein